MSTYTPIASQTLSSATSSVAFTSIPQGYTDLVVVIGYKAATTNYPTLRLSFNGSATGYSGTQLYGTGSTAGSNRNSSAAYISIARAVGVPQAIGNTGTIIINLQNYSNTTTFKTVLARASASDTGTEADVGLWQNTSAITSFSIDSGSVNDFASGSTFSIYGIQVGDKAQKAQGGNIVTTDGTYVYHTFTTSGSFIPNSALTVDYLVVAGGGGGGQGAAGATNGGGGGAGGYRTSIGGTALTLNPNTNYTVTVGAGGASNTTGNNSVFTTITSSGGGRGAGTSAAATGGSGGGGARLIGNTGAAGNAGSYSPVEGYAGGNGTENAPSYAGGGGGGSSAVGGNFSNSGNGVGGNGGAGTANSISGSSVTYAGGGGGAAAADVPSTPGSGGAGGGGAGSVTGAGVAGTANTGGGGGGGFQGGSAAGGAGGSGIVIIRYAI
jgi:hypothetical protein